MKSIRLSEQRRSALLFAAAFLLAASAEPSHAQQAPRAPSWWTVRGVIDLSEEANDLALALQGQLEHVARKTLEEFESSLAPLGGAGSRSRELIDSEWLALGPADRSPCLLGQLQSVAAPFYDRLRELNIEAGREITGGWLYPWSEEAAENSGRAPAVIGQLKEVFRFEFDRDGDGLPDWWEARVFGTFEYTGAEDTDEDGLSNLEEFVGGTEAAVADSDNDGIADGLDARPRVADPQDPVDRGEGLEVFSGLEPAQRLLEAENKARRASGLREFESLAERQQAREVAGEE